MTLADLSIRRPVFAWMIFAACIIFGCIGFSHLGVSLFPDTTPPIITVDVAWPGASPEVIQTSAVDSLEQAIMEVQGVRNIESSCYQGFGEIKIEFYLNRNIDAAMQEVNAKVRAVSLPTEVDPPTISRDNKNATPILLVGLTSSGSLQELVDYADLHITDKFKTIPGVASVVISGGSDRSMRVWIDNEKLRKYELTAADVLNAFSQDYGESAAGYITGSRSESNVRMMGEASAASEIGNMLIGWRGPARIIDSNIRLRDVAYVEDGLADPRTFSRSNGKLSIGFSIQKQQQANEIETADRVKKVIDELNPTLPPGMHLTVNFDLTQFTKDVIHETEVTLVIAGIVTGLVCWAFLGSLTATLNVLISIPTSIIGSFFCLYVFHFTLNFFTLLGLSLAAGIVVDDAIMVLENITRHHSMGKTLRGAALDGAREITFAAAAASFTLVAIFSPSLFVGGTMGIYFYNFGLVLSCAVLISLLESITLTPMRCSRFMHEEKENAFTRTVDSLFARFAKLYRRQLKWCLDNPLKILAVFSTLFIATLFASFSLFPNIEKEMAPSQDTGTVVMRVRLQPDVSLEQASHSLVQLEDFLRSQPEARIVTDSIGDGSDVSTAQIFITLVDRSHRERQPVIIDRWRKQLNAMQGLRIQIIDLSQSAFSTNRGTTLEISLQGPDYTVLQEKSEEIIGKMRASGEFTDMDTNTNSPVKEYRIAPDRQAAARAGISVQTIAQTITAATASVREGFFTNGDRRYDVRIKLLPEQLRTPEDLQKIQVRTESGELVSLGDVTTSSEKETFSSLNRTNRQRAVTLYANSATGVGQGKAIDDALKLCQETLPPGYQAYPTGSSATQKDSFGMFPVMLGLGLLIAYMIMAVQFNSFVHPTTVFLALPFTFTGAFFTLLITHSTFNIYSGIGILLLMGISMKNALLLVEFFNNQRRQFHLSPHGAVYNGAPIRLRPIIMTSCAAIASALPAALDPGPGIEVRFPIAAVVIGGVIISTACNLLVIPCAYVIFAHMELRRNASGNI